MERRCLRTYVSRFADGKAATPYRQFMGYHHSKDGTPEVMEAKAKNRTHHLPAFSGGRNPGDDFQITQSSRKSLPSESETETARVRKKRPNEAFSVLLW